MHKFLVLLLFILPSLRGVAESWQDALSRMPLSTDTTQLNRTNCVQVMLNSFQSNATVKALIFMPGATDEFYMFRRAKANLTNASPTLLDAVNALTNQTLVRATFLPPFLLLHSDEDPLEPLYQIKNDSTLKQLRQEMFVPHALYYDKDWDYLLPILKQKLGLKFVPELYSRDSWHFYRHSFAAWNLNGWETLQAISMAGKTRFIVKRNLVIFEADVRVRKLPTIDHYPKD
ncbi:hypothetical protein [Pedosphaera parvula]|uniref:Uncharacterized protein n=1 Tax=Pedosphaera parvula (strain Ellin514) TaxID=320771 RepID=B9XF08_PEDPL|nr:hypothetical protein [Pedosphaera parvula]EEF61506.1 hypothetical protein Cflav_PD4184 [Pedosphaera parvula Ellin514]